MIKSLQRNLGERIHKLGSSSWGIRVEYISRCGWKLGKYLIEKNINIALRVVRHVRPQHNCILISSSKSSLFSSCLFYYSCLFKFNFFPSPYFYSTPSSLAYKLGIYQRKYKQSPCGLDTRSFILIFTTCDKIGTLVNLLTTTFNSWQPPSFH